MAKRFEELTITDDFMFCKVMQNERICKRLLNSVLQDKIGEIVTVEYQKTINESGFSKGTRMDVWVTDIQGRVFDVEMQAAEADDLAKRMRYYQSQVDMLTLAKGFDYEELPDSFIIFFCPFDYPKAELPVYTFRSLCAERSDIILPDGAVKIIINSSAAAKEKNEDLRVFMDYMNGEKKEHPFIEEVEAEVTAVKENDVYRAEFFSWNAKAMDLKRAARKEGFQRGVQQGMQQGIQQGIQQGMQQGIQKGIRQKEFDDISKMAAYLQSRNASLTEEEAREEAARILR